MVLMAAQAMRLFRMAGTHAGATQVVNLARDRLHMHRVNAATNPAQMIDCQPIVDCANQGPIDLPVIRVA